MASRDFRIFRRLVSSAKGYWVHLIASLSLSLVSPPLALLAPLPLRIAVDNVIGNQPIPSWVGILLRSSEISKSTLLFFAVVLIIAIALIVHLRALASWI